MKILVLYEELAWYFINCLNVLAANHNVEILLFSKTANSIAPFQFKYVHPKIILKDREEPGDDKLFEVCKTYSPNLILIGGWSNKTYLRVVKEIKTKQTIIGFDNQWQGTFKQKLGSFYFKNSIRPYVNKAFVPGSKQVQFAKKIGFDEKHIIKDAYCCDFYFFNSIYKKFKTEKQNVFPKRFLFVGRYVKEKGIEDLWKAFIELEAEHSNEWELWCLGKGNIKALEHPKIKHFGFIQLGKMEDIISQTGVFVLPSLFEPWGVVVHEYASAGFPLLCSTKVGAAEKFVSQSNGLSFEAGNVKDLKEKMRIVMKMSQKELNLMAEESVKLAAELKPSTWADNLMKGFLS